MTGVENTPVDVVFIAGFGRGGSTLLAQIMGQLPRFVSVGELRHLWLRGAVENQLCGCGQPFRECTFWGAVAQQGFSQNWEQLAKIAELQLRVDAIRLIPQVFFTSLRGKSYRHDAEQYCQELARRFR